MQIKQLLNNSKYFGTYVSQNKDISYSEHLKLIKLNSEWEAYGIQRGVDAYHSKLREDEKKFKERGRSQFVYSDVGAKIVLHCMRPLVEGFKQAQNEAEIGHSKKGAYSKWWTPILCLHPEELAAITIRTVLAGMQPPMRKTTQCAIKIAENIRFERDLHLWKDQQFKNERELGTKNLFKAMTRKVKKLDARSVRKFMRFEADTDRESWSKETKVHLGNKCLELLVRWAGEWSVSPDFRATKDKKHPVFPDDYHKTEDWFATELIQAGYSRIRTTKFIKLTPEAEKVIEDNHARCEFNKPYLVPMLCPPIKWRWRKAKSKKSTNIIEENPDTKLANELQKWSEANV